MTKQQERLMFALLNITLALHKSKDDEPDNTASFIKYAIDDLQRALTNTNITTSEQPAELAKGGKYGA